MFVMAFFIYQENHADFLIYKNILHTTITNNYVKRKITKMLLRTNEFKKNKKKIIDILRNKKKNRIH